LQKSGWALVGVPPLKQELEDKIDERTNFILMI